MNRNLIFAAAFGFAAGLGAGITGSFIFLKKRIQKEADKQVDDVKNAFERRINELENGRKKKVVSDISEKKAVEDPTKAMRGFYSSEGTNEEIVASAKAVSETRQRINYNAYSTPVETAETDEESAHPMDSGELKGPVIIRKQDFGADPSCEPIELTYYSVDGILTDQFGNEIDNVLRAVGSKLRDSGFDTDRELHLYIRNEREGRDYHIEKVFQAYADDY